MVRHVGVEPTSIVTGVKVVATGSISEGTGATGSIVCYTL